MQVLGSDWAYKCLEIAGTVLVALDRDGKVFYVNRKGSEILGLKEDEILGMDWIASFVPERQRPETGTVFRRLMAGELDAFEHVETALVTRSGEERLLAWHNTLLHDEEGAIVGILSAGEDITERRRDEEAVAALVESTVGATGQECFDRIVAGLCRWLEADCALVGLIEDGSVRVLAMERDGELLHDYRYSLKGSPCENVHQGGHCIYPAEVHRYFPKAEELQRFGAEGYAGIRITDKNGRGIGVLNVVTRRPKQWPGNLRQIMDVIAAKAAAEMGRMRAEAALQESEEKYRQVVENALEGICIFQEGRLVFFNPQVEQELGCGADEIAATPFFEFVHPDDRERVATRHRKRLAGEAVAPDMEYRVVDKEGRVKWIKSSSVLVHWAGAPAVLTFFNNVTERKRAGVEKEKLEAQLRQAYKLEAMGTMAAGIAHEFNNMLTAILGFADLVREELPDGSLPRADIDEVLKAAGRARDLVGQILAFSRQEENELRPVELYPVLKETLKFLKASTPSSVAIQHQIVTESTRVRADPTQMQRLVLNLCSNAVQAMGEKGVLEVRLEHVQLTPADVVDHPHLPEGDYLELSVRDNGVGMDEATRNRMFDPFFSTKDIGAGTGMGLAVVHGIVEQHQGMIKVDSAPGQGTTVYVYLPVVASSKAPAVGDEDLPGGSERILVVDDEAVITRMLKQMLERFGYAVTAFTDSGEALEAFRAEPQRFDLVITDQTMPALTGEELAEAMLAVRADIPIILLTGYSSLIDEDKAKAAGIRGFSYKPFSKLELATTVRTVLDQVAAG